MDIEKIIEAVKLCGSTPKVDQCKQCIYWAGGDMSKCIPRMTADAVTALSTLQAENERLWADLEQVKREREADIKRLRKIDWCAGCKDFCGLNGCAGVGMANCTVENDHYQFGPKEG